MSERTVRMEGVHGAMELRCPAPGVVVLVLSGQDAGELGDRPFRELERILADGRVDLFIDGRDSRGPTIDVSNAWAEWLARHRKRLDRVTMLTGSRFVEVTASFVRRFAKLEDLMRVTTDPAAFDSELALAVQAAALEAGDEGGLLH